MINQIEHNEVKSSQISENEVVGSKDSSGTIIHVLLNYYFYSTFQITVKILSFISLFNQWNGVRLIDWRAPFIEIL